MENGVNKSTILYGKKLPEHDLPMPGTSVMTGGSAGARPSAAGSVSAKDEMLDLFEKHWTEKSIMQLPALLASVAAENAAEREEIACDLIITDIQTRFRKGLRFDLPRLIEMFPSYEPAINDAYLYVIKQQRLGEYEYYEQIGSGGMGKVYRGQHRLMQQNVAVKLLKTEWLASAEHRSRFLREMKLGCQLIHPNFVRAVYGGEDHGRYYIVMDYVKGKNLRTIVKDGPLSVPLACSIIMQTANGLQFAVENGIIHRDIKPENIMLAEDKTVKILDFGLGKFTAEQQIDANIAHTVVSVTMGSVDYIAPEQWKDAGSVTFHADIYSLGCVFFFLLTGRAPFERDEWNREQRMIAHLQDMPPEIAAYRSDCPEEVEQCIRKMLAKTPAERFAQPADVIAVLRPFADEKGFSSLYGSGLLIDSGVPSPPSALPAVLPPKPLWRRYLPHSVLTLIAGAALINGQWKQKENDDDRPKPPPVMKPDDPVLPEGLSAADLRRIEYVPFDGRWREESGEQPINFFHRTDSAFPAADLHSQAVRLHFDAIKTNDFNAAQQAQLLYAKAAASYDAAASLKAKYLKKVCQFDAANLDWWLNSNPERYQQLVNAISADSVMADDILFRCELQISAAEKLAAAGQRQNSVFDAVRKILCDQQHEHAAEQLDKRYAAVLMKQWQLSEAETVFRRIHRRALKQNKDDVLAADVLAAAVPLLKIQCWFGNHQDARKNCRELLAKMKENPAAEKTVLPYKIDLRETLADSMFAELVSVQARGQNDPSRLAYCFTEGIDRYKLAAEETGDNDRQFILRCKSALLRCVGGQKDTGVPPEIYGQPSPSAVLIYSLLSLLSADDNEDNDNTVLMLHDWLDKQLLITNPLERYEGQRLALHLLALHILFCKKSENQWFDVEEAEKYIVPLLKTVKMLPPLLPYYDAVIQCCGHNIPQQAFWIAESRHITLPENKSCLLFYFPMSSANGFAVFIPQDRQQVQRFLLPYNRQQIIECSASGDSWNLPKELLALIQSELKNSRPPVLFWDDSECWSQEEQHHALTVSQWRAEDLPASLFWGTVK